MSRGAGTGLEADLPSAGYLQCAELAAAFDPERSAEALLQVIGVAARLATEQHCYRFADGRLENPGLRLAESLPDRPLPARLAFNPGTRRSRSRRVLHVASTVFEVGGHSRMIAEWVRRDTATTHCLVTTQQEAAPPSVLANVVRDSGGQVWTLGYHSPLVFRASWLRTIASFGFDAVVLHIAPYDVIPLAAFGAGGGPPVALLNHADHLFWLGGGVSDVIVNLRPVGTDLSRARRFATRNCTIPIPVSRPPAALTRDGARRELGIPDTQVVLVSLGRALKFTPSGTHDFYRVARRLLSEHPAAHLYLLGPDNAHYLTYNPAEGVPDRLHLLGPQTNPLTWLAAADVYLESFPFGSQTGTLEAAMMGPAVVLALAPTDPLLAASDVAFEGLITNAGNEDEYCRQVRACLEPGQLAGGARPLTTAVRIDHVDDHWLAWLQEVYDTLNSATHRPHPLPSEEPRQTPTDIAISAWLRSTDPEPDLSRVAGHLSQAAYFAREAGEWASSLRILRLSARLAGLRFTHVKAAAKVCALASLHRISPRTRPSWSDDLVLPPELQSGIPAAAIK